MSDVPRSPKRPPLNARAKTLATYEGRMNALAELDEELAAGGNRDVVQALLARLRLIKQAGEESNARQLAQKIEEANARLEALEEAQAAHKGFARRADTAVVPPSREGEPIN